MPTTIRVQFVGADGERKCNCCNCCDVLGNGVSIMLSGGPSAECVQSPNSYDIKHTGTPGSANVMFGGSAASIGTLHWDEYNSTNGTCTEEIRGSSSPDDITMYASATCDKSARTVTVTITSVYINRTAYYVFNCETLAFISSSMTGSPYGSGPDVYTVSISEAP